MILYLVFSAKDGSGNTTQRAWQPRPQGRLSLQNGGERRPWHIVSQVFPKVLGILVRWLKYRQSWVRDSNRKSNVLAILRILMPNLLWGAKTKQGNIQLPVDISGSRTSLLTVLYYLHMAEGSLLAIERSRDLLYDKVFPCRHFGCRADPGDEVVKPVTCITSFSHLYG